MFHFFWLNSLRFDTCLCPMFAHASAQTCANFFGQFPRILKKNITLPWKFVSFCQFPRNLSFFGISFVLCLCFVNSWFFLGLMLSLFVCELFVNSSVFWSIPCFFSICCSFFCQFPRNLSICAKSVNINNQYRQMTHNLFPDFQSLAPKRS